MLKKPLTLITLLCASMSFAAVDVNQADAAALDAIAGIGPGVSARILEERKKKSFLDWNDLIARVRGVGKGNAEKLSDAGLRVNAQPYKDAPEDTQLPKK
jgi:competence protein ComEA